MSNNEEEIILPNTKSELKPVKLKPKKIIQKKINLCQKYFYMEKPNKIKLRNFYKEKNALEQVDDAITNLTKKRTDLDNTRIECIKSMILNNKKIPEKWIMKPNYKDLLFKAMNDDIVLNYAIVCKDIHKKRAGYDDINDDERYENYLKSQPKEKRFISYINPFTRNYTDSNKKKDLMKEYDKKHFKKFYKLPKIILNNSNNNNNKKEDSVKKNNSKENIKKNKHIKFKNISCLTEANETKNDLMVTSLHYTGLDNDNENNKNNNNNNDNNNGEQKKKIELKLPEIII